MKMRKSMLLAAVTVFSAALLAAAPKFPGYNSTDRAALKAAAEGGDALTKLRAKVRLAQLDTPEETATYAKQSAFIRREMAKLGLTDEGLVYSMPLAGADGKQNWCLEGWHAAHKAGDYREMYYLVNTVPSVEQARAELGDTALFRRYALLLKKNFGKYNPPVVATALIFMARLTDAVDPVDAVTDLTQIRARIVVKAQKFPDKWGRCLDQIDKMLAKVKADAAK